MNRTWVRILACSMASAFVTACDPADRVRIGMPESDVLKIMGQPSRTVDDATKFGEELVGEHKCRASARRILVYNVTPRRRVRVVLNTNTTVTCVVKTDDLMH